MRARDLGLNFGKFETGTLNKITDVEGVLVGHETIKGSGLNTGLTVIAPHSDDLYDNRVMVGVFVLNGYGKSIGLMQVEEMGYLETPIAITGTFNVGLVFDDVVSYVLKKHRDARSVNPVILECNDSRLSDPEKRRAVSGAFLKAMKRLREDFELGCVGAGTGMVAFGFKSGVGSASRRVGDFTVGVLSVPNFGRREDLTLSGKRVFEGGSGQDPGGSVVVVIATDAPLTSRQLRRLSVRASHGIARTGGRTSNHSGDVILAFSTSFRIPRNSVTIDRVHLNDDSNEFQNLMDAVIDATEESILDALLSACGAVSRTGEIYGRLEIPEDIL